MSRLEQLATGSAGSAAWITEQQIRLDERARLGRELHDSTSQLLVAMQLRMAMLKNRLASPEFCAALSELDNTIHDLHREIRAVLTVDNPLEIASGELPERLSAMAERFGLISGMSVELEVAPAYKKMPKPMKAALYRIAQEALANAHQHGQASQVRIQLRSTPGAAHMTVLDNGIGISGTHQKGCGIANMRARAAAFGGRLSVRKLHQGTKIFVSLPR